MRKPDLRLSIVLVILLAMIAGPATGRHAERSVVIHRTISALPSPDGLVLLGLDISPVTVDVSGDENENLVSATTTRLSVEAGLNSWLRLHMDLPFHAWSDALPAWGFDASGSGLGDAGAGLVLSPLHLGRWLATALDVRTTWPTGDEALGLGAGERSTYLGAAVTLRAWTDASVPEMWLHANFGRRENVQGGGYGGAGAGRFAAWGNPVPAVPDGGDDGDNDPLEFSAALEFRKGNVSLAVEHTRHFYPDAVVTSGEEPAWWSAAVHWGEETGPGLTLAYDVPTSLDDPATAFRPLMADHVVRLGVGWSFAVGGRDRDGDGLKDRVDPCPDDAEDFDGFRDDDGCPDPDNDEDGVPDVIDQAPMLPEDHDGFKDHDGVPDPDNDRDGILDVNDQCPDEAEDFDGHQDDDGCPEEFFDADGDGIPDEDDVCPDEAEDLDGYRDDDGCPDLDNDLDGIPDALDACPDQPEDYDGVEDEDGCPE